MFCDMRFRRRIASCASQLGLSNNIRLTTRAREHGRKRMKWTMDTKQFLYVKIGVQSAHFLVKRIFY